MTKSRLEGQKYRIQQSDQCDESELLEIDYKIEGLDH